MSADNSSENPRPANPAALSLPHAARLLSAAGGKSVPVEWLAQDVSAGAPRNADGTINLVQYTAWLVKEVASGGD